MRREFQSRTRGAADNELNQQALVDALSVALVKAAQENKQPEGQAAADFDGGTIDLMELLYHVLSKIKYVIASALIGAILLGSYGVFFITPVYQATAKLYITGQDDVAVSLSDLQLGSQLKMDYQEVFKTWEVHQMVREELDLDLSYGAMQSSLNVYNPEDTRVLYVTFEHVDAQMATDIANAYANAAREFIMQTMGSREPNMFSIALVPSRATGMSKTNYVITGFLLGTVLSLGVIFLHFVLDDRPHTPEEIMKTAGLPTLAVIPKERDVLKSDRNGNRNRRSRPGQTRTGRAQSSNTRMREVKR